MYHIPSRDIRVRDPYIVPLKEEGKYYLFGTTDTDPWNKGEGFLVYESLDLENWSEPKWAFRPPEGFFSLQGFRPPHHSSLKNSSSSPSGPMTKAIWMDIFSGLLSSGMTDGASLEAKPAASAVA